MSHSKSICSANSRDLWRSVMLAAPRGAACRARGFLGRKLARKMSHFDGGEPGFVTLVPAFEARAVDGLFQRVAGQHAEGHRNARIELRQLNSARRFRGHVIVMRSLATQNASDADD